MNKKFLIGGATVVLLVVIGVIARSFFSSTTDEATFIQGDLTVRAGELRVVKNGAPLSVTGDLTVLGTLACESTPGTAGALFVKVGGVMDVSGTIECLPENVSDRSRPVLTIIASRLSFSESANVSVNGSVDIVTHETELLADPLQVEVWRTLVKKEGTTIAQVGPFVSDTPMRNVEEGSGVSRTSAATYALLAGTWHVGDTIAQAAAPTEVLKRMVTSPYLSINMGDDGVIDMNGLTIESGDGKSGASEVGADCDAIGETGGDALFFRLHAGNILAQKVSIRFGNGGKGGDAETRGDCAEGQAVAGTGGRPGNMLWSAAGTIEIARVVIIPGKGGSGGDARAHGKSGVDGCPGEAGGNAQAVGGDGGVSPYMLPVQGDIRGVDHITISRVVGGDGGSAQANGGVGGTGATCGCQGGKGGAAIARGGTGGLGTVLLLSNTVEGHGGDAGGAGASGGAGGDGGLCTEKVPGGKGGDGGNAVGTIGEGGRGTTAKGTDGMLKEMLGGDGGEGGSGCPPGEGGIGGLGAPLGLTQAKGISLCTNTPTVVPKDTGIPMIKAIIYHGFYLPKDQLRVSDTTGCGEKHWRAAKGSVIATNGETVEDPLFACGFGKVSEMPIVDTLARVLDVQAGTP